MKEEKAPAAEKLHTDASSNDEHRRIIIACVVIFFVALSCRLLSFQDNRFEARKVQTAVTEGYKHTGRLLQQGGISSFFSAESPLSDPNHLGHPPGYPIFIAAVFSLFGEAEAALQFIQILADSAASILVFFIALSLLNRPTAIISGLLVALAPQFTYNSTLLLPDSLSVVPILLAIYLLIRAFKRPSLPLLITSGALVGLSCWLRANLMLLAPFMLIAFPILFERRLRLRYSLALIGGTVLAVAPLTIRNFIVYDHFVPISLGAGQTFIEGISDYDPEGTLGLPNTDMALMKWEAENFNRPDYYGTLFNPDGVKRDRERIARGFAVVRSHPFWFLSVMVRRGASMLRLERVRLINADPPVSHSIEVTNETQPAWSATPADLLAQGTVASKRAETKIEPENQMLRLTGDESKYDNQFFSPPITVEKQTDYVLKIPIRIEQGRMTISVVGEGSDSQLASAIVEPQDWKTPAEQPLNVIELPFVSASAVQVRILFANGGSQAIRPVVEVGQPQLYALGPSSFGWTRIPRAVIRILQKLFVTAVMLPLAIIGLLLLIHARKWRTIVLLLIVPAYFLCVQSALHTEYRYVLALHYFLFVFVALALYRAFAFLRTALLKIRSVSRSKD
jgi:hypothetical protein